MAHERGSHERDDHQQHREHAQEDAERQRLSVAREALRAGLHEGEAPLPRPSSGSAKSPPTHRRRRPRKRRAGRAPWSSRSLAPLSTPAATGTCASASWATPPKRTLSSSRRSRRRSVASPVASSPRASAHRSPARRSATSRKPGPRAILRSDSETTSARRRARWTTRTASSPTCCRWSARYRCGPSASTTRSR